MLSGVTVYSVYTHPSLMWRSISRLSETPLKFCKITTSASLAIRATSWKIITSFVAKIQCSMSTHQVCPSPVDSNIVFAAAVVAIAIAAAVVPIVRCRCFVEGINLEYLALLETTASLASRSLVTTYGGRLDRVSRLFVIQMNVARKPYFWYLPRWRRCAT